MGQIVTEHRFTTIRRMPEAWRYLRLFIVSAHMDQYTPSGSGYNPLHAQISSGADIPKIRAATLRAADMKAESLIRLLLLPMLCVAALVWLILTEPASGGPPVTSRLLVDGLSDPLAMNSTLPQFSWILHDPDRGEAQSAYQILVASSRSVIDSKRGDLWDSGKVVSSASTHVRYAGSPLAGKTRYWWNVRAWDRSGTPGPYSKAAFFETGLWEQDWKAEYIWDGTTNSNNYCYLRKRFTLPGRVTEARAYLFAHDDYRFFINSRFVGRGPAPSDPYDSALYNAWDITSMVTPGENAIAIIAHYHGEGTGCGVRGTPAFIFQAEIECEEGTHLTVTSDASWKVLAETPWNEASPCRGPEYAQATSVEDYDARQEVDGWKDADFYDALWKCAGIVEPGYQLKAQTVPVDAVDRLLKPVSIETPVPGIFLIDFGMNSTGWPVLKIEGAEAGHRIRIWYAEEKDGNRIIRNGNEISHYYDQYTCRGGGTETWEPDTKYNGFRYVEVEGYPGVLTPDRIYLKYLHTTLNKEGAFRCSSPLLNRIYEICVRTQTNACQGILVDCPQREQTQYAADAAIQGLNLFYNFSYTGLHRKFLYDLRDSATEPGVLWSNHPSEVISIIPEWMLHWPIGLWNQYLYTGDQNLLRDLFPTLQELLIVFQRYEDAETGLLADVPGRALSDHPMSEMDMSGTSLTPQNCLYFRALVIAANVADTLGYAEKAAAYKETSTRIRQGINAHLFDGKSRYRDCSGSSDFHALSSVFPLYFDIVPEDRIQAVLEYVVSRGFEPSVYGGFYLCETLYRFDRDLHMYKLLHQEDRRWAKMLSLGATTTWEAWLPVASRSHAWSAYPMKFLLSGPVGIEPITPGFSTFSIRPRIKGDLLFTEGTVPTPRGRIVSQWYKTSKGLRLHVEIPVNTKAWIQLPTLGSDNVMVLEGGHILWKDHRFIEGVQGISFLGTNRDRISFTAGSGTYAFELFLKEPP
jgi:alpha-L-rhamnosidase